MPMESVLGCIPIKSRVTAENVLQRIYIKSGNTKSLKLYAVGGHTKKSYLYKAMGHFVKSVTSGYKIVIILPIAFPPWWWYYSDNRKRKNPFVPLPNRPAPIRAGVGNEP